MRPDGGVEGLRRLLWENFAGGAFRLCNQRRGETDSLAEPGLEHLLGRHLLPEQEDLVRFRDAHYKIRINR